MNDETESDPLVEATPDVRFPTVTQSLPKIGEENPIPRDNPWPQINMPTSPFAGSGNDSFRPQQHDAFDEVLLRADIMGRDDEDFSEKIGWIYWRLAGDEESSSSSSSLDSGGAGDNSDPSDSKDTAIVKASYALTGNVAMFVTEMPEVRFEDISVLSLEGRRTKISIDPHFTELCHPGTLLCCGFAPDLPVPLGIKIEQNGDSYSIIIQQPNEGLLATEVVIRFTAIRNGFLGTRLPERTDLQRIESNATINSAYSGRKD